MNPTVAIRRIGDWLAESAGGHPLLAAALAAGVLVAVAGTALVALPARDAVRLTVSPPNAALTFADMAPGDTIGGTVTVANSGTLPLRYAMSLVVDDDADELLSSMRLTVAVNRSGDPGCAAGGDVLYSGPLTAAAVGDATLGADPGDRLLRVGEAEELCFQATFLPSTSDAQQGTSGAVSFSFSAEGPAD